MGVATYLTIQRIIANFQNSFDLEIPISRILIKLKENVITRRDYLETFLLSSEVEELGLIVKKYDELSVRIDNNLITPIIMGGRIEYAERDVDKSLLRYLRTKPYSQSDLPEFDIEIRDVLHTAKSYNTQFDMIARNLMKNQLKAITINKDVNLIHNSIRNFFNVELKKILSEEKENREILSRITFLRRLERIPEMLESFPGEDIEIIIGNTIDDVNKSNLETDNKKIILNFLPAYKEGLIFLKYLHADLAAKKANHERMFKEVQYTGNQVIELLNKAENISTSKVVASIEDNKVARKESLAIILITWILSLSVSIIFSFIIIKRMTNPLIKLSDTARNMSNGIFGGALEAEGKDEIALLIDTFNQMSQKLKHHIAELKRANKKIIAQERLAAIGQITTGIAHEIRNPLSAIKMNIQILSRKCELNENDLEYWDILIKEVNRLDRIVNEILDYSQKPELSKTWCDLHGIIKEAREVIIKSVDGKITFLENYDWNIPQIYVDANRIKQVLLNILINSCQSMGKNKLVGISTGLSNNNNSSFVKITISDKGKGIRKEHVEKIFDPFFSTKVKGIGLGLSISKRIVEEHGGKIEVESVTSKEKNINAVDEWSTKFNILIPMGDGKP